MNGPSSGRNGAGVDRHQEAVNRTLEWADEAAARCEYGSALGWLEVVEAVGDELPAEYKARRRAWLRAAREEHP